MFDSYCLLNEKVKKHIIIFLIIVTIIFNFLLLLLNKIKVPIYLEGTTTLDYDTNFLLKISIPQNKLTLIQNHNHIFINEKKYNYQLINIEKDKTKKDEVTVHLTINLEGKKLKKNTTITYRIEIAKINFFDYLKQK